MSRDTVLVTGASRGLGLETALSLAERGFHIWAGVRDGSRKQFVERAAQDRGVFLDTVPLDVTDTGSVDRAISHILERSGHLYGVVNNAGVTCRGYFEDLTDDEIRRIFEVNVFGTMNVTRRVLPHLRSARHGRIIVMSSIAGRVGSMALTAYVASKFALEGFSESLSLELSPLGLQVVIIEPGIVETEIWNPERRAASHARDPQGPYYNWFCREEKEADALVHSSKTKPRDVAVAVWRALTVKRPRLRYVVGRRASLVLAMRRHLPGELFERIYFKEVLRRITGHRLGVNESRS